MYTQQLKIPKERIAVLIGTKAETKREIEKKTNTELEISSEDGSVLIKGEDSLNVYLTKFIIQAIARGFNPELALTLLDEDYCLEIINIKDYCGNSKKKLTRLKSRLIGTEGNARKNIEKMTNTNICVYGKTVSILGELNKVLIAKEAVICLLKGAPHGNAYKYIEKLSRKTL